MSVESEFDQRWIENKPELGYEYEKNKSGQMLVRGGAIFSGYYKDPEATKEAFDEYGFYRTGDVVRLREDEKFQIIDRAKNFFKLTQGEFVSSESVENDYLAKFLYWFTQVWITGDKDQSFTVGLFAVDRDKLARFARHYGFDVEDIDIDDLGLKRVFYGKIMKPVSNDESFQVKGFEKVKNFKLFSGDFMTIDNDTLTTTTTMKIRRHKVNQVFKDDIKELYEEGEL
ncbi:hypothetical protein WICPIJ_003650 [Wickerhamomyces pijperi]|uniref:AMP-dependent synthetase/ligase domain-containing protein n=1 Tax=Wickerhamomyces pijperi TaxID=599730 RepID=A0A9P8Q964_WICPI|nr:hypothetical protein WICPIJ_003650 [Wickerhamomyces pijperi]